MEEIEVALAAEHEARACLSLMPEAAGLSVELLIAKQGGVMAGAAAIFWQSWAKPAGFPILVHVLPDNRRRGVGRALADFAANLAAEDTDGLWSFTPIASDDPAVGFLGALSFGAHTLQFHYEATVDALYAHVEPLARRLDARAAGAAQCEIGPVTDDVLEEVGWLISSSLGGGPISAMRRLRGRLAGAHAGQDKLDRSQVATAGNQVAGALLWRTEGDTAVVDARVVAPPWRGGLLNLRILQSGLVRMRDEGVTKVRFQCDETVKDTIRLAQRCNAIETARTALYYRPFD